MKKTKINSFVLIGILAVIIGLTTIITISTPAISGTVKTTPMNAFAKGA